MILYRKKSVYLEERKEDNSWIGRYQKRKYGYKEGLGLRESINNSVVQTMLNIHKALGSTPESRKQIFPQNGGI